MLSIPSRLYKFFFPATSFLTVLPLHFGQGKIWSKCTLLPALFCLSSCAWAYVWKFWIEVFGFQYNVCNIKLISWSLFWLDSFHFSSVINVNEGKLFKSQLYDLVIDLLNLKCTTFQSQGFIDYEIITYWYSKKLQDLIIFLLERKCF